MYSQWAMAPWRVMMSPRAKGALVRRWARWLLFAVGQAGEQFDGVDGAQAALHFAAFHLGAVRGALLDEVDGVVVGGQADAVALQGGQDVHADIRVGEIVAAAD